MFGKVGKNGVPNMAVLISVVMLLGGVLLNYIAPKEVFTWLTAISTFGAVWTWAVILVSQLKFRRMLTPGQVAKLEHRMPFFPYGSYSALACLLLVVGLMAYFPETRIALIIGPGWLLLLVALYYLLGYHRQTAPVAKPVYQA